MKIKNIFTYCFISSLFLFSLICIWKILVTLQGIELTNFNFNKLFIFGIILCAINLLIGTERIIRLNHFGKSVSRTL